jgi:arylsulfatase A-like enzyme
MYDHSVRVPFLIAGPNVKKGAKNTAPIYLQDIMPTALDLADFPIPEYVEFKSLIPLLKGKKKHYDAIFGCYKNEQRMIQKDGWKYIAYPTCDGERLYNMKSDPMEMNDLSANPEYAAKMKEMRIDLLALSADLNDPLDYDDPVNSWKKASPAKKSAH